MEKYSKAVREMYSQFKKQKAHPMEKYSQFKKKKAHPMEKYIGRLACFFGGESEVVGYSLKGLTGKPLLIVDASRSGGWSAPEPSDVIFKECEKYWYVGVDDLID